MRKEEGGKKNKILEARVRAGEEGRRERGGSYYSWYLSFFF